MCLAAAQEWSSLPEWTSVSQEWIKLIQDSQFRQQLGAQGRELVRRLFADEIVVKRMIELFQSVIK